VQADLCLRALNELQEIFNVPPAPSFKELRRRKEWRFTMKHLTIWFEPWLAFYELMPHMIHPKSDLKDREGSEQGKDAEGGEAEGKEDNGAESKSVTKAREDAAEDRRVKLSRDDAERVRPIALFTGCRLLGSFFHCVAPLHHCLSSPLRAQAPTLGAVSVQVVLLHNFLAKAANNEAKHMACHEDLWKCVYHFGSGEKYIPMTLSMPAFKELPAEAATMDKGEYQKMFEASKAVDLKQIEDFKRSLLWNLGQVCAISGTCLLQGRLMSAAIRIILLVILMGNAHHHIHCSFRVPPAGLRCAVSPGPGGPFLRFLYVNIYCS
jgi:hypothetical protein